MKQFLLFLLLLIPLSVLFAASWTGSVSTDWNNPDNWNTGLVPTSVTDVAIPFVMNNRYPVTSSAVGNCQNLGVYAGARLTVGAYNLVVSGEALIRGDFYMTHATDFRVTGNITWEDYSTASITSSSAEIYCGGNMYFRDLSDIQFELGYVEFNHNGPASDMVYLVNESPNTVFNYIRSRVVNSPLIISSACTEDFTINQNLRTYTGNKTLCWYTGNIYLKGNLYDENIGTEVTTRFSAGTLVMDGIDQSIYLPGENCSINNLTCSASGTLSSNVNLTLEGNLLIESGTFEITGYSDLHVSGNADIYGTLNLIISSLHMYTSGILNVRDGGRLFCNEGYVTCDGGGNYIFNVRPGGTIAAVNSTFEKMNSNGLYVWSGAFIDPAYSFTECTFQNGATGGTLLLLNNSANVQIKDAVFPANTWGGASNVWRTVTQGVVNFTNATGAFSGEAFDNDSHNAVFWNTATAEPDFKVLKAVWSSISPSPYLGETRTLTVTVINNSTTVCSENVWLDFYYDLATPPEVNDAGQQYTAVNPLAPGLPQNYIFIVSNYDPTMTGLWNSYLFIDSFDYVVEGNETNNIFGPFNITWQPLPIVPVSISRNPATNLVTLSWTYPLTVSLFNIYSDTNPYGTFTTWTGSSTLNSWSIPGVQTKLFFQVKAERSEPAKAQDLQHVTPMQRRRF